MNPKAICADMAFRHPHDMQAFYRMHNVKRISTGPRTPLPNRPEMGVRLFKNFLLALVDTASKNLDQTTLVQITPATLMLKAATVKNTLVTLVARRLWSWPWDQDQEISWTPTPTKQDLINEEIQKLAMKTHLEVQQREDIRRDLAERMKFVPPGHRAGDRVL